MSTFVSGLWRTGGAFCIMMRGCICFIYIQYINVQAARACIYGWRASLGSTKSCVTTIARARAKEGASLRSRREVFYVAHSTVYIHIGRHEGGRTRCAPCLCRRRLAWCVAPEARDCTQNVYIKVCSSTRSCHHNRQLGGGYRRLQTSR